MHNVCQSDGTAIHANHEFRKSRFDNDLHMLALFAMATIRAPAAGKITNRTRKAYKVWPLTLPIEFAFQVNLRHF